MTFRHPDLGEMLAHIEGNEGNIAPHLAKCDNCASKVEELIELLDAFTAAKLPDPPAPLVEATLQRVRDEIENSTSPVAAIGERLQQAIDKLSAAFAQPIREFQAKLDTGSLAPSPQFRGGSAGDTRLFQSEPYDLVLGVDSGEAASSALNGQVIPKLGAAIPAGAVALLAQPDALIEAPISELGQFCIAEAPDSNAQLALLIGSDLIRVELPI